MTPVLNAGLNGMHTSYSKITQAAHQIARAGQPGEGQAIDGSAQSKLASPANTESTDLIGSLVEMKQQQHVFTASAKVVSVANETLGSLIDDFL